ncbi:MAG: GNAT family N-acetyltransferase [Jatrophihabitantaceae bacterium]
MTSPVRITRVQPSDWSRLRTIRLAALLDTPRAFGSTYERELAFDEATWRARTTTAAQFLACDGDQVVGLAGGLADSADCTPEQRLLVSVWVAPTHRGHRIVAALVDAVAAWALTDGATSLLLDVATDNEPALHAYERLGFVATGVRKPMPRDEMIIEQAMVCGLNAQAQAGPRR